MQPGSAFGAVEREIAPLRAELVAHPMYARIARLEDVHAFMELHVFAVWDFMSLVKALQRELTSLDFAWRPRGDGRARRFVNEIVVAEESDHDGRGGYTSHFELYVRAMQEAGASTAAIERTQRLLELGRPVDEALAEAPRPARAFSEATFQTIAGGSLPRIAAAFTLGREDVIPDMFTALVRDLSSRGGGSLATFADYLRRHIEIDGEQHGPMSRHLLECVCGDDRRAWREACDGAAEALRARIALWDAVVAQIDARRGLAHAQAR